MREKQHETHMVGGSFTKNIRVVTKILYRAFSIGVLFSSIIVAYHFKYNRENNGKAKPQTVGISVGCFYHYSVIYCWFDKIIGKMTPLPGVLTTLVFSAHEPSPVNPTSVSPSNRHFLQNNPHEEISRPSVLFIKDIDSFSFSFSSSSYLATAAVPNAYTSSELVKSQIRTTSAGSICSCFCTCATIESTYGPLILLSLEPPHNELHAVLPSDGHD